MKKNAQTSKSFLRFSFLLILFSTIYSCQNEELTPIATDNTTKKTTSKTDIASTAIASGNWETDCINDVTPYFKTTDQKTIINGGNTKIVDIEYYNTATNFVLKIKSTKMIADILIDNETIFSSTVIVGDWRVYTVPLSTGWKAGDLVSYTLKATGNGSPAEFPVSYNLIGVCPPVCETSFIGKTISCGTTRTATYTLKSDKDLSYFKIQGGLTNFTGTDAIVTFTGGNNITTKQSTPGGSTNRIIKIEGGISKCSEVTITVIWNSSNGGEIITGSWSVKDANGTDIAPEVSGLECK